jgi:YHS domain-containing protein
MNFMKFTALLAAAVTYTGILFAADIVPAGYPLKKCVISDESLGEMGKPVKVTSEGTDVYLCCKNCIKDFNKQPAKYVKMVKDAAASKK